MSLYPAMAKILLMLVQMQIPIQQQVRILVGITEALIELEPEVFLRFLVHSSPSERLNFFGVATWWTGVSLPPMEFRHFLSGC